jgi:hypothetical protein
MANNTYDIASGDKSIKRNPSVTHPWARHAGTDKSGLVWLHINARKILDQQSKGVGTVRVAEGKPFVQFAFLAPLALTESVVHNWAEYDSLASRLAQKARTAAKIGAEWNGLMKGFSTATPEDNAKTKIARANKGTSKIGGGQGQLISSWMRDIYNRVQPHSIQKLKVDTPLYYESSDRRNLTFEVMLIGETDPLNDIVNPVKDLMKLSSPNLVDGGISIDFPYMFEVFTQPKKFLKYTTLALTAVQPTWNHPYIGGYPSSCNLQLTFKDMSPLYRGAIEHGSVINVIPTQDSDARKARGDLATNRILRPRPKGFTHGDSHQSVGQEGQEGSPANFPEWNQISEEGKKKLRAGLMSAS